MWLSITILGFGLLLAVVALATRTGSKSAQLKALKEELKRQAKEQARANKILDNVRNFDEHTVRQRLHEIANKER